MFGNPFGPHRPDLLDFFVGSERDKVKKETEAYQKEAKALLAEANDLNDRIVKPCQKKTERLTAEVNEYMENHALYKQALLKDFSADISNRMDRFQRFDIDSRILNPPKLVDISDGVHFPRLDSRTFCNGSFDGLGGLGGFDLLDLLLNGDPFDNRDKARDQRDQVRRYLQSVKNAAEYLKETQIKLKNLKRCLENERETLEGLRSKLYSIVRQLESAMEENSFSSAQAARLKGIFKIAERISESMKSNLLEKNGEIDKKYEDYCRQLEEINESIPERPKLTDNEGWLTRIAAILQSEV